MTTVFLKVISSILQQHEELLRKYKKKALTLKDYDGIFLKARTTADEPISPVTGPARSRNISETRSTLQYNEFRIFAQQKF